MRFRFTLFSESKGEYVLPNDPIGWDKMEISLNRGQETHGFFYEQTVNLKFICGAGKEYIDEFMDDEGIDGVIRINIEISCTCDETEEDLPDYSIDYSDDYGSRNNGDCDFMPFYEGIFNLKSRTRTKEYTEVEIIESSFFQTVRNRLETVVDIMATESLDGTPLSNFTYGPYDLNLHSKAISLVSEIDMIMPNYSESLSVPDASQTIYFTYPVDAVALEENTQLNVPTTPLLDSTAFTSKRKSIFTNNLGHSQDYTFRYNINGELKEMLSIDRTYNLALVYAISNNDDALSGGGITLVDYGLKNILASVLMTQTLNESGTISVTIPDGYSLYVYFVLANYDGSAVSTPSAIIEIVNTESSFTFETVSVTEDSIGKAYARFETGAKICQYITGQIDSFRSSYFGRTNSEPYAYPSNGYGSFASFLSGFWVRGFPITGQYAKTMKMSLNDYFISNSAIENLGLGIEKIGDNYYVVMERMNYFYDSSTILLTLNYVPDITITEAPEYYISRVNIGFNKWETEFRNGLDEFNSKRFYDLGIKSIETSKEIYSNFVAGGYPLEFTRRKDFTSNPTTDSDYDEENFIVYLNRTEVDGVPTMLDVAEKDENFTQVNNILSPETSYNLRCSPAHNYLRHNDTINPVLLKYPGRNVKFLGGEGNYKMESEFTNDSGPGRWNNDLLAENQNIQWDSTSNTDNNPIWIPEIATFKFPITFTQFQTIKANPKGVIMVSDSDSDHIPYYILEAKYVPANGGLADFKLLRAFQA